MHEGLNALFVGGEITQTDFTATTPGGHPWAHVGRIELSNNMWSWSKQITYLTTQNTNIMISSVYGLAVDPSGSKVAVYTNRRVYDDQKFPDFVVTLDAATGFRVSKSYKIVHNSGRRTMVTSNGMLL